MSDLVIDAVDDAPTARRIRFDAPARRNALTLETVQDLLALLEDDRDSLLLLGSTTEGMFCSGADLDVDDASRALLSDLLYACYEHLVTRNGTVIAVVDGPAVGGGAQLSTAADLRIITSSARWRWVGPGHGLAVGAWILPALVGRSRGLDLTLTSRWLSASEAVQSGLASQIDESAWSRSHQLARHLASADRSALARVKQLAADPTLIERLQQERSLNRDAWSGSAPTAREASEASRRQALVSPQSPNPRPRT